MAVATLMKESRAVGCYVFVWLYVLLFFFLVCEMSGEDGGFSISFVV